MQNFLKETEAFHKLQYEKQFIATPKLIVSDFDGSLFTPDVRILYESLHQNKHLMKILRRKSLPLILNTGRTDWSKKMHLDAYLVGIKPDVVIAGAGTRMYHRQKNKTYTLDTTWQDYLAEQTLVIQGKTYCWGDKNIAEKIQETVTHFVEKNEESIPLIPKQGNPFLIRYTIKGASNNQLLDMTKNIEQYFIKGVKAIFTEHLVPRSFGISTGDILLIPTAAGKDNATDYLLKQYATLVQTKLLAYCFGDGTIDLHSFLIMQKNNQHYTLEQFLVHPTPFAKELFANLPKEKQPIMLLQTGPTAILQTVENRLSLAQNSTVRKLFIEPTSSLIDHLYPKELQANDISLLGLKQVKESIDQLYDRKTKRKGKALRLYLFGLFADVADGIRARNTIATANGQLVDVFSDRAREFYQLYKRGLQRLETNPEEGLVTLEAAISCILPSLARSQAEIMGKTVQENAKGAAFWRTKKLFASLMNDIVLKNHRASFAIDKEILETSLENYHIRLQHAAGFSMEKIEKEKLTDLQKKAAERWLLLVALTRESISLVKKKLSKNKEKQFLIWLQKNQKEIWKQIAIEKQRKIFGFQDNKLFLQDYLQ